MADFNSSIIRIDCQYVRPQFAAAYLVIEKGRAAFVDNNTTHAVPILLSTLKAHGLTPEAVDCLIVTHAHLDHAGGTSELLKSCPNAQVLAHPKAAKTLIRPERLIQSAKKVYGEEIFAKLYGNLEPIPEGRMRAIQDGEEIPFGDRKFIFFHTLGHATHHMCLYDSKTQSVFTGDAFGLRYLEIQSQKTMVVPSTSPIDYDPIEAKKAVEKIMSFKPKFLYPTHFGEISNVLEAKEVLRENLDIHENIFHWACEHKELGNKLSEAVLQKLKTAYLPYWECLKLDLELNAQGIAFKAMQG